MVKKILIPLLIISLIANCYFIHKYVNDSPSIVITHDTIPGDSVFVTKTIYKSLPYKVIEYNTDTIKIPTDTIELKNKYRDLYSKLYASKTYIDSLKNVSDNDLIYNAYISQNSLDSLKISLKNNRITTVNNTIINNNKPKFQAGVQVSFKSISPVFICNVKDNFNISANYDILNKSIGFGILYNIK